MHRAGLLPTDYVALGGSEEVGRKLLAAAVHRGEPDLRSVRGVRRELLERIEAQSTAEPLRIVARAPAADGFVKYLIEPWLSGSIAAVRSPVRWEAPEAGSSGYENKEKKYIVCVSS